jgi:hypothetical protein
LVWLTDVNIEQLLIRMQAYGSQEDGYLNQARWNRS